VERRRRPRRGRFTLKTSGSPRLYFGYTYFTRVKDVKLTSRKGEQPRQLVLDPCRLHYAAHAPARLLPGEKAVFTCKGLLSDTLRLEVVASPARLLADRRI